MQTRLIIFGLLALASCTSTADAPTTTPPVATVATTTKPPSIAPPTTETTTTTAATTSTTETTTTAPTTTEAPPPTTTSVEDQILEAITRAQVASINCYNLSPGPCDQKEIDDAYVGAQRQLVIDDSQSGAIYENANALRWTIMNGPTLKGDDLAIATICRFDPIVATYKDGTVNDGEGYYIQQWSLVPVGQDWKVSAVISLNGGQIESEPCDE